MYTFVGLAGTYFIMHTCFALWYPTFSTFTFTLVRLAMP
jgi:hypothetical protein